MVCRAWSLTLLSVWDFRSFSWDRDVSFILAIIQSKKTLFQPGIYKRSVNFLKGISGYLVNPLSYFQ